MLAAIDRHRRNDGKELELTVEVERTTDDELPSENARFHFTVSGRNITCLTTPFDELDYVAFERYMRKWQNSHWQGRPNAEVLRKHQMDCGVTIIRSLGGQYPTVETIPEFRQIVPGEYNLKGTGVVELLAHWQSPDIGNDADRDRFNKVEQFLRELLGMSDIKLDITRKSTELVVDRSGFRLPLKNYGTGIHQLIILAIAVLAREKMWIAIEEPEIHLHPLLQKAFLRFIIDKTNNQYILTTHSNAFLSRPQDSHIVHLWLEDGETKNRVVETTGHILQVLDDLGIRQRTFYNPILSFGSKGRATAFI